MRGLLARLRSGEAVHLWATRLEKTASFGLDDWRVIAEAILTLVLVKVVLRFVEFPRLLAWAKRLPEGAGEQMSPAGIERTAWLATLGGRFMRVTCLPQSLALARVLARRGVATDIRIGVRTENGRLLAHAWVEWTGQALSDHPRNLQRFAAFDRTIEDALNV